MSANKLLTWMSARGQGSWQQFRAAVEELHISDAAGTNLDQDEEFDEFALPYYQELRLNLQRLGHAEFFSGAGETSEWRITPPSLAVTQREDGWLGVLAGARTLTVLQRVRAAASADRLTTAAFSACPDQLLLNSDDEDELIAIAERASLFLQRHAPSALLSCLPSIDDSSVRQLVPLPFGADWKIERYSTRKLRWQAAAYDEAVSAPASLFRFSLRHQRHVLFCSEGLAYRLPVQVGKFFALRRSRRRVLRYDVAHRRLSVPASCRPPFLIERALILCSGALPRYESDSSSGTLSYDHIPRTIAQAAAALLRQELR
jgi:hypothetical protein